MAGTHYTPAQLARFARRAKMNNESMLAFLAAILALASIFILFNYFRRAGRYLGSHKPSLLVALARKTRRVFNRKVPGLPSAGHSLIVSLYVAINVIVMFTNIDRSNMNSNVASRAAWLAVGNTVLVVFLALKNTPLAMMSVWSYERLNVLHQIAGYATVALVIIHASCYSSYFVMAGRSTRLLERDEIYGMVAGVAFLMLGFVGAVVRRWYYELFYYLHVVFALLGLVMTGLHQPELSKNVFIAVSIAGGLWGADRIIRFCRLAAYSTNNSVTLTALPNGGTRVTLTKPPIGADSGKHCFLWIPSVRACETHPFTIAAMGPLEFVVASYDGFTHDLHKHALEHPGAVLKASVEGAYGTFPDPVEYDKLVLVAGGSGASFTFGVLQSMLRRLKDDDRKEVIFVWIVRHQSYIHWYSHHLTALLKDSRVSVQIYVTRGSASELPSPAVDLATPPRSLTRVVTADCMFEKDISTEVQSPISSSSVDLEKTLPSETGSSSQVEIVQPTSASIANMPIRYHRPDVGSIIRTAIDEADAQMRVAVMGCGPHGLMTQMRNVTASCIRADGPAVELHCEQFGW